MKEISARVKRIAIAVTVIVLLVVIGGAYWYYGNYTNTPEYALQKIEEAIDTHNKEQFYKYVNTDHLVDTTSDYLLDGLISATSPKDGEASAMFADLYNMFNKSVKSSMRVAIDNYIATGSWKGTDEARNKAEIDNDIIIEKLGLEVIDIVGIESLKKNEVEGKATAHIKIRQNEISEEYVLDVDLVKNEENIWQIYEITNLKEVVASIMQVYQEKLREYLTHSEEIIETHRTKTRDISGKLKSMMMSGSLGNDDFRAQLKQIVTEELTTEWKHRKEELEQLTVPEHARSLQNVQLKICDANIEYCDNYAKWLDDKSGASLRKASAAMKQGMVLEEEANHLTTQIHAKLR